MDSIGDIITHMIVYLKMEELLVYLLGCVISNRVPIIQSLIKVLIPQ